MFFECSSLIFVSHIHTLSSLFFRFSPSGLFLSFFQLGLHWFLHTVCVSSVLPLSPSLFLPLCTSRFVLCLLMWNLVGDVFVGPGLKGFLSDPPQLVALPYFLFCSRSSLSLSLSQCSSVFLYCHFLCETRCRFLPSPPWSVPRHTKHRAHPLASL